MLKLSTTHELTNAEIGMLKTRFILAMQVVMTTITTLFRLINFKNGISHNIKNIKIINPTYA